MLNFLLYTGLERGSSPVRDLQLQKKICANIAVLKLHPPRKTGSSGQRSCRAAGLGRGGGDVVDGPQRVWEERRNGFVILTFHSLALLSKISLILLSLRSVNVAQQNGAELILFSRTEVVWK